MARYVKFMRGTPKAFEALVKKDEDTLYFIHEKDALDGCLYLGSKKIAGEGDFENTSIDALEDVLLSENIAHDSFLVYDKQLEQWVNKNPSDILYPFIGATIESNGVAGLVPPPEKGKTNLFLRSDGSWVNLENVVKDPLTYRGLISNISDIPTTQVECGWVYKVVADIPKKDFSDAGIVVNWLTNDKSLEDEQFIRVGDLLISTGEEDLNTGYLINVAWDHFPTGYNADYVPVLDIANNSESGIDVRLTSPHATIDEMGDLGTFTIVSNNPSISIELNDTNKISIGLKWGVF